MAAELEIIEGPKGLLVRSTRPKRVLAGLIQAATAAAVGIWLGSHFFAWPLTIFIGALLACADWLAVTGCRVARLSVTNSELTSFAHIEGWLPVRHRLALTDVKWLEYQEDTTGAETAHHPGGLYAVVSRRSVCPLPDLDEQQTAAVIERIYQRFTGFREQVTENSPFDRHFAGLQLDRPSRTRR